MPDFWNWAASAEDSAEELRIDGVITEESWWNANGTTPTRFRAELKRRRGKDIRVCINSPGGEVTAASAIYTALTQHKGRVTVQIDGMAASAASLIAMAGDEVIMSPTAQIMIHNPLLYDGGDYRVHRHIADILEAYKESLVSAYEAKTGLDTQTISDLMDKETQMTATRAVELGFADAILPTRQAAQETAKIEALYDRKAILNCFHVHGATSIAAKEPTAKTTEQPSTANAERLNYVLAIAQINKNRRDMT